MNTLLVPLVTGAEVTFWVVAPITILGALGLVLSRRAVYAALSVAVTMIGLAALYASLDAPFLAMVQIIVYTGAVLMMFLFVLMMVGIITPDSTVETLKGQRPLAILGGIGILAFLFFAIGGALHTEPATVAAANSEFGGNVEGLANLLFGRYVFVFELSAALLIVAAVGAMLLAHGQRVRPRKGQPELAADRMYAYKTKGEHPGSLPNSGVYAGSNAIGVGALLPDGTVSEKSISQTLVMRGATIDPAPLTQVTGSTFAAIEAVRDEDEED
ncbi:MAG: NADH-quinone oxidoreductase subunit J [Propioniciclava sp.]|nr:NADH-quinone oxidoreductase subunit J [Propioniciclava sp.]